MIKLGIAEDNTTFRDTLVEALELRSGIEIAFAARNGKDALHRTMQLNQPPEVILMDIDMPQLNGIEATRRLTSIAPQTKVIMLSIFDQEDQIFEAILSGASGYLLKGESPDEIVRAIHDVLAGRLPMSPAIATGLEIRCSCRKFNSRNRAASYPGH